jgi:hypothetical protein
MGSKVMADRVLGTGDDGWSVNGLSVCRPTSVSVGDSRQADEPKADKLMNSL